MPPIGERVTLRESRVRLVIFLAFTIVGVVTGVAMGVTSADRITGLLVAALCLLGTLVLSMLIAEGRTLTLDHDGFVASIGLPFRRPIVVAWRDVIRFSEVPIPGGTVVGFQLHAHAPPVTSRLRRAVDEVFTPQAPDGTLPTTYAGMSASETIKYLERWRGYAASLHDRDLA